MRRPKEINNSIAQFLTDFKDEADLSIQELIDIIGVSKSSTYEYLRADREPTIDTIIRIKNTLEISCDVLLLWNTFTQEEKNEILQKLKRKLVQFRFKYALKTNAIDFFTNTNITMYSKDDVYAFIKELYYNEKRKVD